MPTEMQVEKDTDDRLDDDLNDEALDRDSVRLVRHSIFSMNDRQ